MCPVPGLALAAIASFGLSLALVPLCRRIAGRLGYVARARDDRWHSQPTPLFGGIAIAAAVFSVYPVLSGGRELLALLAGAAGMFVVGLVDDLITIKPHTKFLASSVVASMLIFFGYRLDWTGWSALDMLLTMVWIVGVTNAVNLLDNMDGLSAGVSLIAAGALLGGLVLEGGSAPEALYLAVFLGAIAGFLVYNFHPASIFMGDAGSLFLGLNLAVLAIGATPGRQRSADVLSVLVGPLLVLLVPILDTTLVTVSRILSGRSAAQGGRDHTSHRLVAIGLSERGAVAVLWMLAAFGGLLALALRQLSAAEWPGILAALFLLASVIFTVYLANVRVYRDAGNVPAGPTTPFVAEFMYKRRVAEVVLDLCLVTLAYYAAYRLRFESRALASYYQTFLDSLPIVVAVQMLSLFAVGAYRGVWKFFGLMDGVAFGKAVLLGTVTSVSLVVYFYRFENYSRGVFVIYAALLMLLLAASRASFRLIGEFAHRRRSGGQRLVIYGTGDGAATAVRDLLSSTAEGCRMLGFIDDDPAMARARMQGYPVLGGYPVLVALISSRSVDAVVITTPVIDVERLEHLKAVCAAHDVSLSRLNVGLDRLGAAS
jgi:UDP-GlcNAc:undecaprenyl-phosphate GlcNAc-1-phosphate transferase